MAQTAEITAQNPLAVRPPHPSIYGEMGDPTGLVAQGQVICFNDFENGPQGWGQLYTHNLTSQCPVAWMKDRHKARIEMRTPDLRNVNGMAIRRMSESLGPGFYLTEFMAAISESDANAPRTMRAPKWYEWAVDAEDSFGGRNYFTLMYGRNVAAAAVPGIGVDLIDHLMLRTIQGGSEVFYDLGAFTWPVNEQKCLPVHISLLVNTQTGKYVGIRVGRWLKRGYFADGPDTEFDNIPPADGADLVRFRSGYNALIAVLNLPTSDETRTTNKLLYHRSTYLGVALP